jgi:hypothetical protein
MRRADVTAEIRTSTPRTVTATPTFRYAQVLIILWTLDNMRVSGGRLIFLLSIYVRSSVVG